MVRQFRKTKLATAVGAAAVSLGLSTAASAVVVVGGDNGWEVSFDGNINAFYVQGDYEAGWSPLGYTAPTAVSGSFTGTDMDVGRVTSGFLPAFFSFNVKSPTVNGMTATGRFSFAPTIQNGNIKNQLYAPGGLSGNTNNGIQGASIDTREVLVNIDGAFGTVSFGRTLSIFGRNAILKDQTLFGVGISNVNGAAVSAGRIGRGYTYPNFNARFSYKTPNINGLQAEIGLYDPSREQFEALSGSGGAGLLNETDMPRFEGELSYTATYGGGSVQVWIDGLWQDIESTAGPGKVSVTGFGGGADVKFGGFNVLGYIYTGEGLGRSLQFVGGNRCEATGTFCEEADNDGFYLQGSYTFSGTTKLAASYGESNEDGFSTLVNGAGLAATRDVELSMYSVGVYHDINSWLRVMAEYSAAKNDFDNSNSGLPGNDTESDTFSVGSFLFW